MGWAWGALARPGSGPDLRGMSAYLGGKPTCGVGIGGRGHGPAAAGIQGRPSNARVRVSSMPMSCLRAVAR